MTLYRTQLDDNEKLAVAFLAIFTLIWLYVPETYDKLNIERILAVAFLLLFSWRYMRKRSEYKDSQPVVSVPAEYKWKQDFGSKVKNTKEIVGILVFLVMSFYFEENAIYFAVLAFGAMRLAQYLLLEPKREILESLLAIVLIAGFVIVIALWAASRFFSAGLAALFLVAFFILFIWLFWGDGLDWVLYRIRHASGKSRRKY